MAATRSPRSARTASPPSRRDLLLAAGSSLALSGMAGARGSNTAPFANPRTYRGRGEGKSLLVLGGTAFLGPHAVESALAEGYEVTLFNRGRTNTHLFPDLETLVGDRDPEQGEGLKALEGDRTWDAVLDTTSYVPGLTKAAAELLAGRIGHYHLVSTISVYANFDADSIEEDYELEELEDPTTTDVQAHYGGLKALCEQAAEAALPGQVSVTRPGLIVGPGDPTGRFTYWPVNGSAGGELLAPGSPDDPVQFIDARDLADLIVRMMTDGTYETVNAVGPVHGSTMGELAYTSRAIGTEPTDIVWVPAEACTELGLRPWGDLPVWAPSEGEMRGLSRVSADKAIAAGLQSRPVADTLRDTLAWYRGLEEGERGTRLAGMDRERQTERLSAWREKS